METGLQSIMRTKTSPIDVVKSTRRHEVKMMSSMPAGRMVPLAGIPLLREDRLNACRLRLNFESMETAEILMNAINVRTLAYFVPFLAFERFKGMDDLNRSYRKEPYEEGDPVVPFIETAAAAAHGVNLIHKYMGLHARSGQTINMAYVEAYNAIWNFRAKNRSPDIAPRTRLQNTDLAPAFWPHEQFKYIVPDFDQAVIDGEVALNVVNAKMPVQGISVREASHASVTTASARGTSGEVVPAHKGWLGAGSDWYIRSSNQATNGTTSATRFPDVFVEMQENGITVSLSNIEMAKKTQAFARLREQYVGHTDEYIIDLLMDGITIPEQMWRQPILLADKTTIFGMAKRYASDSGNLTESVVNGQTGIDLSLVLPQTPTGGVVMIVAEIVPDQLFERRQDTFLHTTDVDALPHYLRDTLDPEKVEVVQNQFVENAHTAPTAVFGYAPLNHKWAHPSGYCIGGKFFRPTVDASFDEDRQRLWANETPDPVLSEDFYLAKTIHTKPFVVTNQDPFEVVMRGDAMITGNTVFGAQLIEPPAGVSNYDKVMEEVPVERIEKA